ncbi:hypothetical protein GCM10010464_81310 [Pseudonocardia yunnanensis]
MLGNGVGQFFGHVPILVSAFPLRDILPLAGNPGQPSQRRPVRPPEPPESDVADPANTPPASS